MTPRVERNGNSSRKAWKIEEHERQVTEIGYSIVIL